MTAVPGPDVVVKEIDLLANPAAGPVGITDPSSEIDASLIAFYQPSQATLDLYNDMYQDVLKGCDYFDLSTYDLSTADKSTACELLNYESTFRLPHLQTCKLSMDLNTIFFSYETLDTRKIQTDCETISAKLSHILYNVPPEDGSDLARFTSVFQYLIETTDSAPVNTGIRFAGPDSLLLENSGICWGYAQLASYILPRIGIPCNMICNDLHTWNQVEIAKKLYHTDLSFAAGAFNSRFNSFETFLMDETERERTLSFSSMGGSDPFLGYDGCYFGTPSLCEDMSFQVYGSIHELYALDVENEIIYVNDYMGIKSMNLDGTSPLTLSQQYISSMAFFDGTIYYTDFSDGNLYSLIPGQKPLLINGDGDNDIVFLDGAGIRYGTLNDPNKYIRLLPSSSDIEMPGVDKLPVIDADRSLSYYFTVKFSTPMDTTANWTNYAILTNENGDPLLTRQTWNEDRTVMTVRPLHSIDEYKSLSFYVLAGAPSQEGGILPKTICLPVTIHSIAEQLPAG